MVRIFSRGLVIGTMVCTLTMSSLWCRQATAEEVVVRPLSVKPIPLRAGFKMTPQISGRAAVVTGRERLGITSGTGTSPFLTSPMHSRPEGFVTQTRKLGDNTVLTGRNRIGVTRAHSTGNFGTSSATRGPVTVGRSGLSTVRHIGKSRSGITHVK
ncbi:MAG: hypothetical protein V4719_30835 [Planctomycetota bacterium]